MGIIKNARKKVMLVKATYEREQFKRLTAQRKREEAAAIRSKLRQSELKRIAAAKKTREQERNLRAKGRGERRNVDFSNVFFDTPKKKKPVKRTKRKVKKGGSGKTITINLK